jgi:hypothetical protein
MATAEHIVGECHRLLPALTRGINVHPDGANVLRATVDARRPRACLEPDGLPCLGPVARFPVAKPARCPASRASRT